jgi:hypothetical protein
MRKLILALTLALAFPAAASAAPVTTSVNDPQDAPLNPAFNRREPDVKKVTATYDDLVGNLSVTLDVWEPPNAGICCDSPNTPNDQFTLLASFGAPPAGADCSSLGEGVVDLEMMLWPFDSIYSAGLLRFIGPIFSGQLVTNVPQTDDMLSYSVTFQNTSLARRNMLCISAVALKSDVRPWKDEVDSFCFGECPVTTPPPDSTPPSVNWTTPRDGQTVSGVLSESKGNCLVDASDASGIDHTENYIDGELNDQQFNAPWSCELNTVELSNGLHTLTVVAFDKAGNRAESRVSIRVNNSRTPPPEPPQPQRPTPVPVPVTQNGTPVPEGPSSSLAAPAPAPASKPSATKRRVLTNAVARRTAMRAFRRDTFRRDFARRRGFRITCRKRSNVRRRCIATWTTRVWRYRGQVDVTLVRSGRTRYKAHVRRTIR